MKQRISLASRLSEVLLDGTWIANTNFRAQLLSLNYEQATRKVGNLNTIAALTFHINYYLDGILNVFRGGGLEIHDQFSFDVPEISSEAEWRGMVDTFIASSEAFVQAVQSLPAEILDKGFVEEKYGSYLRNIEGVIEHSYYHLGQVTLIKKIILEQEHPHSGGQG
ncbi:DUF1572 domain-containing protein [Pedobacter sp. GR22-6]|uniref:DUF1572 domain-containing protein n=1 Tax=Pedobacter sp. GR22-6 TaxID=3127957 RepID=UPI00307CDD42